MKNHIVFNTDDAQSILDSDNIGAYTRSADGNLITDHHVAESAFAYLISQGIVFRAKAAGTIGNGYSFTVTDSWVSGPTGPLSFTEIAGAIVLDLNGLTPTSAQVVAALASSTTAWVTLGTPTGNVVVAASASFSGGENTKTHSHLDVYSITADSFGNAITSHVDVAGTNSLDVHITNPQVVNVDIDGIYSGSNLAPANVGLIGSTRSAPGVANQTLQFTGAGVASDNVATTNIMAQDVNAFGMMWDSVGSNWDRLQGNVTDGLLVKISNTSIDVTGTVELGTTTLAALENITVSGTVELGATTLAALENITVSGTVGLSEDHNWGAVGATTLRVAAEIGNASGMADFGSGTTSAQTLRVSIATDASIAVSDAALANTAIVANIETLSVANTAQVAVASPLANRKYLNLYNPGKYQIFIGGAGVTAATGYPIFPGSQIELRAGASSAVYFVGETGKLPVINHLELS